MMNVPFLAYLLSFARWWRRSKLPFMWYVREQSVGGWVNFDAFEKECAAHYCDVKHYTVRTEKPISVVKQGCV